MLLSQLVLLPALLMAFPVAPPLAPQVQDLTLTPTAGAVLVATAEGRGVQVYTCTAQNDNSPNSVSQNGGYSWILRGPEAVLYAAAGEKRMGTHSDGPTWTWSDGSALTGKVIAQTPSPEAGSVPWLLLQTQPTGAGKGVLTPVTLVRRSDTQGGTAPALGCDPAHAGTVLRVPYRATYSFYAVVESPAAP